jgi:hypothetical protein
MPAVEHIKAGPVDIFGKVLRKKLLAKVCHWQKAI